MFLLCTVNLINSGADQAHLTFIVHPPVQRQREGLMCHCHFVSNHVTPDNA